MALLAVAALATALGWILYETRALQPVELASIDARFELRGTQQPLKDVVIVGVDTRTLRELQMEPPLPRSVHGRIIDRLRNAGASVIAYDFVFAEPTEQMQDSALLLAVRRSPGLVLAATRVDGDGTTDVFEGTEPVNAGSALFPVAADGVVRRVPHDDHGVPSFAVETARLAGHDTAARFPGGGAWIDYAGPGGTVPTYSFSDVLAGRIGAQALQGRIVVVGATDPRLQDIKRTPFGDGTPGPEVQANAIATVLRGLPLRDAPGWEAALVIAAAGAVAPLAALRLSGWAWLWVPVAVLSAGAVLIQTAFDGGTVLPAAPTGAAWLAASLGTLAVAYVRPRARRFAGPARRSSVTEGAATYGSSASGGP
jgi:CHASE2 domain-containing sensor protein